MNETTLKLDADRLLDRLRQLHGSVRAAQRGCEVELYHRASLSLRVGVQDNDEPMTSSVGHEEGLAVRTRSGDGTMGFAACSGADEASVRWALQQAERAPGAGTESSWASPCGQTAVDHDERKSLPSTDELERWLRQAWEHLLEGNRQARAERVEAWVEVAETVESWAADGPWQGTRSRVRAWGVANLRRSGKSPAGLRPVVAASRGWETLQPQAWQDVLSDRLLDPGDQPASADSAGGARLPVLFNPESSATLVMALVKTLHLQKPRTRLMAGPGWRLADVPDREGALFGGTFDDGGFPKARKELADGREIVGFLSGPGHLRRASFRDPPSPQPSQIMVVTEGGAPPSHAVLLASTLAVHPLGPEDWCLEVEGALLESGEVRKLLRAFIRTTPEELVRRCLSAVGPARDSHLGVRTPGLLFDELDVLS